MIEHFEAFLETQKRISEFLDLYKKDDKPKIKIISTGCGGILGLISAIPGCSTVLDSISLPWSYESLSTIVNDINDKAVSLERVTELWSHAKQESPDCFVLAMTGSLSTDRYRKGKEEVYIKTDVGCFHLNFKKLSEEEYNKEDPLLLRSLEEYSVASVAIMCILNDIDEIGSEYDITITRIQ